MTSDVVELEAYRRANASLLGLIRGEQFGTRTKLGRRRRAEAKLERTRTLVGALGDPGCQVPIVHVTGTSGKGSTSAAIAAMLTAAGYRVGLRTSPYLQVATEKLQIGPSLIDACSLEHLTQRVLAVGRRHWPGENGNEHLGYAEAWSAMAMQWFGDRNIDIGIIEVGSGGRFDTTNIVHPVVSVITSVGLDHVVSLGPTIADIAWHKAGIIKRGSIAVVGDIPPEAFAVIAAEAKAVAARLIRVNDQDSAVCFPAMDGAFQRVNARVAVSVVHALRDLGFNLPDAAIQAGIAAARLPGRLERMPGKGPVDLWIDGAHNPDKVAALAREVTRLAGSGPPPVIVLGILGTKDFVGIAAALANVSSAIVTTEPSVAGKRSLDALKLAATIRTLGYAGPLHAIPEPVSAVKYAERVAEELGSIVLVTGSMYLAGQARRYWYPDDDIVLQRTPWPREPRSGDSGAL